MTQEIMIAGFGGQGVLFAGKTLAYAGMDLNKNISWLPSYGPEMRGGTANCSVILSDVPIGSPIITNSDVLIAMNKPSLEKFEDTVRPGGVIILDSIHIDSKVKREDVTTVYIPAMKMAEELGNVKLGNMVMLGAYAKHNSYLSLEDVTDSIKAHTPAAKAALGELNIKMVVNGYHFEG